MVNAERKTMPETTDESISPEDGSGVATTSDNVRAPTGAATKKRTVRKQAAKKSPAKKSAARKLPAKKAAAPVAVAKFPRHDVISALRVPEALYKQNGGNPATAKEAVVFAGGTSLNGNWKLEISSSKKYGFLESRGNQVAITDRARRAIAPQSEIDRLSALREAILLAPEVSDVYNFYRGESLPDEKFLINALVDKFGIPLDKISDFLQVFKDSLNAAELIDESGERPRLIDIGRDESHKSAAGKRPTAGNLVPGATCFVMQPFAPPIGTYYESVFKPAIEQAGLTPVRADAEIFGTGKIIDQIWRGISEATVLVAELTTKNANVFYELGLAHALQKPVILVSSNQDDVPFDLKHIRVVLYDQSDPFWGPKLIDKVADKIRSAVEHPEEAIFDLRIGAPGD